MMLMMGRLLEIPDASWGWISRVRNKSMSPSCSFYNKSHVDQPTTSDGYTFRGWGMTSWRLARSRHIRYIAFLCKGKRQARHSQTATHWFLLMGILVIIERGFVWSPLYSRIPEKGEETRLDRGSGDGDAHASVSSKVISWLGSLETLHRSKANHIYIYIYIYKSIVANASHGKPRLSHDGNDGEGGNIQLQFAAAENSIRVHMSMHSTCPIYRNRHLLGTYLVPMVSWCLLSDTEKYQVDASHSNTKRALN